MTNMPTVSQDNGCSKTDSTDERLQWLHNTYRVRILVSPTFSVQHPRYVEVFFSDVKCQV